MTRHALSSRLLLVAAAIALFAVLLPASVPLTAAAAVAEGELDTLVAGHYACEEPGDATGPAARRTPQHDFEVINPSSYRAEGRIGSYLLIGDKVVLTSGPRQGLRFHRTSRGFLRAIGADGRDSSLRCVRVTRNNR